jgi:hypothetical protein
MGGNPDAEAPWGRLRIAYEESHTMAGDILQDYLAYRNPETPLPDHITVDIYQAPADGGDWSEHQLSSTSIPRFLYWVI